MNVMYELVVHVTNNGIDQEVFDNVVKMDISIVLLSYFFVI
jgi:hypothetical protein